jgi:YD repeat-containing protein
VVSTRIWRGLACASFACGLGSAAAATETITYTYDAKGRLVKVERSGSVNNGVTTQYTHDHADNRSNVTVTGSPNNSPPP